MQWIPRTSFSFNHVLCAIPVLASFTAAVLASICVLAGTNSHLESYAIATIDLSKLKDPSITSIPHSAGGLLSGLKFSLGDLPQNVGSSLGNDVESVLKGLKFPDFFSLHILNTCEGSFETRSSAKETNGVKKIDRCTPPKVGYTLGSQQIMSDDDGGAKFWTTFTEIPRVKSAVQTLARVLKGLSVYYCITAVAVTLQFICVLLWSVGHPFFRLGDMAVIAFAGLSMIICTLVATGMSLAAEQKINQSTPKIPVHVIPGSRFMIATWVATGLLVIADWVYIFQRFTRNKTT